MAAVIWAPTAIHDLESIAEYIGHDSLQGAKAQVAALLDRAKVLEKFPGIGRPAPELNDTSIRQILEGRYRLIYQLLGDEVHILTVHHQSMLLQNNPVFKKRLRKKR